MTVKKMKEVRNKLNLFLIQEILFTSLMFKKKNRIFFWRYMALNYDYIDNLKKNFIGINLN